MDSMGRGRASVCGGNGRSTRAQQTWGTSGPGVKVKVRRKFEKAWWSTSLFFDKKSLDNNLVFFFSYDENVTG